ncbi:MAG TPA: hypothetical protein VF384_13265 [Planctomycetota bacterium]
MTILTRLRLVGWMPWVVLGLWAALAAAQEPRMLRGFGVRILEHAAWAGGAVMATILLLVGGFERRLPTCGAIANLLLVLLVALAQAGLCVCFDVLFGYAPRALEALKSATYLVIAWSPLALALPHADMRCSQTITWKILMSSVAICCTAVAAALWSEGLSGRNVSAATVAATGSLLLARKPQE